MPIGILSNGCSAHLCCVDFMFMGRSERIHLYKHTDSRRYLNIARDGTCFRYSVYGYEPIGPEEAIEHVFH